MVSFQDKDDVIQVRRERSFEGVALTCMALGATALMVGVMMLLFVAFGTPLADVKPFVSWLLPLGALLCSLSIPLRRLPPAVIGLAVIDLKAGRVSVGNVTRALAGVSAVCISSEDKGSGSTRETSEGTIINGWTENKVWLRGEEGPLTICQLKNDARGMSELAKHLASRLQVPLEKD